MKKTLTAFKNLFYTCVFLSFIYDAFISESMSFVSVLLLGLFCLAHSIVEPLDADPKNSTKVYPETFSSKLLGFVFGLIGIFIGLLMYFH
ncbi:hypothetical protein [uncultured Tenacibaculum sp.]|uniref:hypothetical protein n=1 Tax=uncultured Tenacibaculum sp. TaxID=174713 RepID=UPI00262B8B9E|nr:hypothetical protein [uncultured Tenacibaculum sp.]